MRLLQQHTQTTADDSILNTIEVPRRLKYPRCVEPFPIVNEIDDIKDFFIKGGKCNFKSRPSVRIEHTISRFYRCTNGLGWVMEIL